jgi:hypothetical protein
MDNHITGKIVVITGASGDRLRLQSADLSKIATGAARSDATETPEGL